MASSISCTVVRLPLFEGTQHVVPPFSVWTVLGEWLAELAIWGNLPSFVSSAVMLTRPVLVLQGRTRLARTCASTSLTKLDSCCHHCHELKCGLWAGLHTVCVLLCTLYRRRVHGPFHPHIVLAHGSM